MEPFVMGIANTFDGATLAEMQIGVAIVILVLVFLAWKFEWAIKEDEAGLVGHVIAALIVLPMIAVMFVLVILGGAGFFPGEGIG